jgi:hypothetical protein
MTTGDDELTVNLRGVDLNLSSLLQKIEGELLQVGSIAGRSSTDIVAGLRRSAGAVGATEAQFLQLAGTASQLALKTGDAAKAEDILAQSLRTAGAAASATAPQITSASNAASQSASAFQQFGSAASSSLLSIVGPAALASAAIGGLISVGKSFADAFKFKAELDQTKAGITALLTGVRDSGQVFQQANTFAQRYKLTQQETTEAISESIPVIRRSKASIEEILSVFTRLTILKPGKTFSDASRAIGELQAGQAVSLEKIFNVPIQKANEMKHEIEGGADAIDVLNTFLAQSGVGMNALEIRTRGAAGAMNDAKIAAEGLALAQAQFAQGPGLVILDQQTRTLTGTTRVLSGDFQSMRASVLGAINSGITGMSQWNPIAAAFAGIIGQVTGVTAAHSAAIQVNTQAIAANSLNMDAERQATVTVAISMDEERQAVAAASAEHDKLTQAIATTTAEMQTAAATSVADTAAKQAQAATTALLEGQTRAAADAFLSLNPNISGSGIASAQAAGQISAAVAQYIAMTLAAQQARNQLAQLQAQAGVSPALKSAAVAAGGGDVGRYITRTDTADAARGAAAVARLKQLNAQEQAHADAVRQGVIQTGSAADKQALLNKELADATRIYGANSTEAIKARTALTQAQQQAAKAGGGGAGGGAVKLSDQQKLNNSLLTDQEKYQQQSEDAAIAYARDTQKIYADFYEKMQSAQRDFNQSELEGRASFYDNLGSIENQKIAKAASAQYEQASIEAGKIAQEKGADVADKYMAAQEQVISARAKRAAEIEKAAKDDKSKAEYLRGVDEQYRRAEDAKIARVKEGEGSLAAERDKQLQDAADKENAAQDKLGTAAERAADRKITASERAGKAIDAELAKTGQLADTYNRIAPAGGIVPPVVAGATPTAAPGVVPPEADPIAVAIGGAKDAIVAALAAVERAARDTTGAVRNLKNSGGVAG